MANNFVLGIRDSAILVIYILLLQWVWTLISTAFVWFGTIASFGAMGFTVGLVSAVYIGQILTVQTKKMLNLR